MKHALTLLLLLTLQSTYIPDGCGINDTREPYVKRLMRDTWTHHIKRSKYSYWHD